MRIIPLNPTRLGPNEAEQDQALESLEQRALAQGITLYGEQNRMGSAWLVVARRTDTGRRLPVRMVVTLRMANHPAEFMAGLEQLLAEAVESLSSVPDSERIVSNCGPSVPNETQKVITLQHQSTPPARDGDI